MSTYDFNLITAFANSAPSNEIEAFPDYDRGLGIAFVETDGKPEMKGLNGLFSLLTVSLLALKQRGILTWTTGFEYKQGAFVVESNRLYQAKIDNTSKQPSLSQNDWQVWASVSDIDVDANGNIIKTAKAGGAFTLKVNDASTTVKGVARFATATEVANRSNSNVAVNPSNVGQTFGGSLSEDGWCRLPNGLILQWGSIALVSTGNNQSGTQSFPTTFPNNCFQVVCSSTAGNIGGSSASEGFQVSSKENSSFSWVSHWQSRPTSFGPISYFAIGN